MAIATFRKIFPPEDCVKPRPAHTLSGETPWELREGMMSMVPLIFIPGRECRLGNYARAVRRAGGVPRFAPDGADGWEDCAGLLLPGGGDLDPALYGQEDRGSQPPDRDRDRRELALLEAALSAGMPVLGICRGIQVMNAVLGGDLYQDIKPFEHLPHNDHWAKVHTVTVRRGTLLSRILGQDTVLVNSQHHQAVDRVAPGFTLAALSEDGIVEAIEKPDARFCLGVQWHPEWLSDADPAMQGLFDAFVNACSK